MASFEYRYLVDSIDDAGSAVLRRDDGLTFPVPAHWLPEEAQPGQRVVARAEGAGAALTLRLEVAER